jgi:hypothetical protein
MITCAGESGALDLYAIHEPSYPVRPPKRVLRLRLPDVKAHRQLRTINTHSSPYIARPETLQSPFVQPQDNRIHIIQLQYDDLASSYTMYIKNDYLLDLMDQMHEGKGIYTHVKVSPSSAHPSQNHFATPGAPEQSGAYQLDDIKYLPWSHWGPPNTRFLEQDLHFQWLRCSSLLASAPGGPNVLMSRYVNGYRVVMPTHIGLPDTFQDSQGHTELCVYDFNVHPKRTNDPCSPLMDPHQQQLAADEEPFWSYSVNSTPTILPEKNVFAAPVISTLPYAVSSRSGAPKYTGFMIDEQRIIGMKASFIVFFECANFDELVCST